MKNEKGMTILSLVVTLVIIAIITFTIFYTADGLDTEVEDDVLLAELKTVHHIVLQEYNKKLTLGNYDLQGEKVTNTATSNGLVGFQNNLNSGVESSKQISFVRKTTENGVERYYEYYKLTDINNQLERCKKCKFRRLYSML